MNPPLLQIIEAKGISIKELTRLSGLSRNAVRRAIRGEEVNEWTAKVIADALSEHIEDLFEDSGTKRVMRTKPFVCPPLDAYKGSLAGHWWSRYGDHPQAKERLREARERTWG